MSEASDGVRTFVSRETREHKESGWSDCQDASLQRDTSSEVNLGSFSFNCSYKWRVLMFLYVCVVSVDTSTLCVSICMFLPMPSYLQY